MPEIRDQQETPRPLSRIRTSSGGIISYLPEQSAYRDFLLALISSDKEKFNSKYACEMVDLANRRGLSRATSNLDCNLLSQAVVASTTKVEASSEPTSEREQEKRPLPQCGAVLAGVNKQIINYWLYLVHFVLIVSFFLRNNLSTKKNKK